MITLTTEECKALHGLIGSLSGHSPESAFAWDGSDDAKDPTTRALVKVYRAAGALVPDSVRFVDAYAEAAE